MKDYLFGVAAGTIGAILGMIAGHWDTPTKEQIGYTKQELKEMKESCEKDLTRSENCIIVVSYKPEGKEEENK